jgi:hypothetical protein
MVGVKFVQFFVFTAHVYYLVNCKVKVLEKLVIFDLL